VDNPQRHGRVLPILHGIPEAPSRKACGFLTAIADGVLTPQSGSLYLALNSIVTISNMKKR